MNLKNASKLLVGGLGILLVGAVLSLASLLMFGWLEDDSPEVTFSLWEVCLTISGTEICTDIPDVPSWLHAVRRLSITATIQAGIALLLSLFFAWKTSLTGELSSRSTTIGVLICGGLSSLLQIISCIVFGIKHEDDLGTTYHLAHAFQIHVIAAIFVLVGTLGVFFSYKKSKISDGQVVATTTVVMSTYPTGHPGHHPSHQFPPPPPPYANPTYPAPMPPYPMYPTTQHGTAAGGPAYPPAPPEMKY